MTKYEEPDDGETPIFPAGIAVMRAGAFTRMALVAYAALWSSSEVGVFWPVLIPVFALPAVDAGHVTELLRSMPAAG